MNSRSGSGILEHFNMGDLLYGLQSQREAVIKELKTRHGDAFFTIDEYNKKITGYLINAMDECLSESYIKTLETLKENPPEKADQNLLEHIAALYRFEDRKIGLSTTFKERKGKDSLCDRQIKRLCKARILDGSITIHFILDGLSPLKTLNEEDAENEIYSSFTSAELRYVIKNFDEIENHIKFYRGNKEIQLLDWISQLSPDTKEVFKAWMNNPEKNRFVNKNNLLMRLNNALDTIITNTTDPYKSPTSSRSPSPVFFNPVCPKTPRATRIPPNTNCTKKRTIPYEDPGARKEDSHNHGYDSPPPPPSPKKIK